MQISKEIEAFKRLPFVHNVCVSPIRNNVFPGVCDCASFHVRERERERRERER